MTLFPSAVNSSLSFHQKLKRFEKNTKLILIINILLDIGASVFKSFRVISVLFFWLLIFGIVFFKEASLEIYLEILQQVKDDPDLLFILMHVISVFFIITWLIFIPILGGVSHSKRPLTLKALERQREEKLKEEALNNFYKLIKEVETSDDLFKVVKGKVND